eukprot:CAMPEP_0201285896 /NCGR_PEP_ID=MMETSP1317-20130820/113966_1 /ASSEMBLY_ACC=CAM_ASM_000770 /TAXON_ID=187299 /ORGANISM="Undescribed Undescribed, Strain Undescribed" /LENGTH=104 /DNA_ID=CAMNT_0047612055 /DNA_START=14 /DNA_END=325 /DNA_ORIENTATION=+
MTVLVAIILLTGVWGSVELEDGYPLENEETNSGNPKYYRFHVTEYSETSDLYISVTKFSDYDDPDVFVSHTNTYPSYDDYDWMGYRWGSDVIVIKGEELEYDGW